ncbi:MAG: C69 family dipeptidase [Bacteroidaceae bacterium]|nr:C69 family dipeptidase [Bacteroidaceae bacterium]
MKRYIIFLLTSSLFLLPSSILPLHACTNLVVGKKASKDGSVIISYSQDDYGAFEPLRVIPAADHPAGSMHALYHYESGNYLGEIPEVAHTYGIVGLMNEHQLSIHETTYGGREELTDTVSGLIDYGSLMVLGLQRSKTAREAIQVMTELTDKYGYESEGESFTIADPNEAWIMDMIGKGPGNKGTVWVAVRIPDDCISGHANQSRIHQFPLKDKKNCLYAKDVISFAKEKGYFNGKDADFSFADSYAPLDFGGLRYCEARIWSYFNKWAAEDMSPYLPFAMGDTKGEVLPLYVKPKALLSVQDVKDMMRDHYEGTPMDMTQDIGMGAWEMPYRPTPLSFEVDGKKYFNERPISTQQSACVYVSQMRSWLPDYIGGVTWFANDDANMVAFTPVYCNMTQAPECYDKSTADAFHFSTRSAYWVENWVSNMVYLRYNLLFPELQKVRDRLEKDYNSLQSEVETKAASMSKEEAIKYLSAYSHRIAGAMMDEWNQLAQLIIVKYNDMAVKRTDENGQFEKTPGGNPRPVLRPGYPEAFKRELIKQTGSRYKLPQ